MAIVEGCCTVDPDVDMVTLGSDGDVTTGVGVDMVTIGPDGDVTVGSGVDEVIVGSDVSVMSALQTDWGVAVIEGGVIVVSVVEVIVLLHSKGDAAVGVERSKEPPVDQKLALKANPPRSASTASATKERAKV